MAEGEIYNLTMEQYLALTRGNQAPGMVKPEIGGNDLLKKAFVQRYCLSSKTAKQLEDIRNFKQKADETLYQAWERYNDLLYKCPTHDINSHQKVNIFYNGLGTMNHQLLDSQGPIPGMTPAQALTPIQTMVDHSQKWHDGSSSRNMYSGNSEGIAAITRKLDSLGRDIKKLKENVHDIQVGCQTYGGAHLKKECPLNEVVKSMEEVKCGEFCRPFPNNNQNNRRRLGMGKLEPIDMIIEMADNTKRTPKGRSGHEYWASCDPHSNVCDGGDSPYDREKCYWESTNDSKREELAWEELSLNDWMRIRKLGSGIRGHSNSYSCGKKVFVWAKIRAFEHETRDLDVESSKIAYPSQHYGVTMAIQLRRNTIYAWRVEKHDEVSFYTNANPSSSTSNSKFLDPKKKIEIESWLGDSKIVDPLVRLDEIEYFDTFPTLEEL
nr:hypothetical protein [Tanacetum cinerariifolium]